MSIGINNTYIFPQKNYKNLKGLISIAASGDHCVLATNQDEGNGYILLLCNALGTPIDTKQVKLSPNILEFVQHLLIKFYKNSNFEEEFKLSR